MNLSKRIKRERRLRPVIKAGFSRKMASLWDKKVRSDFRNYKGKYSEETLKKIHSKGYLARSISKYNLLSTLDTEYITDFEYLYLQPFNNSFSKWIDDILTTNRVLSEHEEVCREVYYSIIERNRRKHIFKVGEENREYTAKDIFELIKEKGVLELRPSFWLSKKKRYKLECKNGFLYVDGRIKNIREFERLIKSLNANYIVSEYIDIKYDSFNEKDFDGYIKLYIANDYEDDTCAEGSTILAAYMNLLYNEVSKSGNRESVRRIKKTMPIDIEQGSYCFYEYENIKGWQHIKEKIIEISNVIKPIDYFTISIAVGRNGFKILSLSANPILPEHDLEEKLNKYLKNKFRKKKARLVLSRKDRIESIKLARFHRFVENHCRPGIRPYMQRLWLDAVKDDFKHTKKSLAKKIWAWKRGFLSYRIDQYSLTDENYNNYLSDYDYHWLNRINNSYQIWVNDKTTFRYILEPFREYIPKYYYMIFKRNGKASILSMQDNVKKDSVDFEDIFDLLDKEGKLAMKPSAGTHGDGFYCLSTEGIDYYVNDDKMEKHEIVDLIKGLNSFYVITEYINMDSELKRIYDKSVNSIRMMVINDNGYDPKIMQAYMRIGSSNTGYTDNVGRGGICVMINEKTGEMYNPEMIIDHKFQPCPIHPDTKVAIEGVIPKWNMICNKVLEICRYMPELEYLGFDIAVTENGFQIIEINIHQDLHKVATHSEEIRSYFKKKIENKKRIYGIQ